MKKLHLFFVLSQVALMILLNACAEDPVSPTTVADVDGNTYHTITIGTQVWMVENLRTSHYRNGDVIPNITDNSAWANLSTGARCDYNNDATNGSKYGHLYNFFAVADSRNIAPVGWHVPTDAEWKILTDYVSAHLGTTPSETKALAATTDWRAYSEPWSIGCNLTLNNSTGFSALPCGSRNGSKGTFNGLGGDTYWWSSTQDNSSFAQYGRTTAWYRFMQYNYPGVFSIYNLDDANGFGRQQGFSVRCIKD